MAKWTKIQDITVKTGTYKDKQGNDKNRYENVGQVLQSDDGGKMHMLKKTFNPAGVPDDKGGEYILLSLFDVKDKEENSQSNNNSTKQNKSGYANKKADPAYQSPQLDDEIPF
jgi:single-stranded DNA-binding protein